MKQYCRYCIYLCVNNVPYCNAHEECVSKSSCKRPNKCKDFIFADVAPEFQDAFGETNGYVPHKPRQKTCDGQMSLDEFTFRCEQTDEELPFVEVKDD